MESHYELFEKADLRYKVILKYEKYYRDERLLFSFMHDFKVLLYENIHLKLEPKKEDEESEKAIRFYCDYINTKILPLCNKKIKALSDNIDYSRKNQLNNVDDLLNLHNNWVRLEDDFFALASFRNLKNFAFYMERLKPLKSKVWDKTMPIFEPLFYYMQEMILEDKISLIRGSYFPGAGKTYAGNLLCAYWLGYDNNMSILRITYSDDLVKSFTGQIQNIMESPQYKKVFPYFDKPEKDVYKVKNSDTIWLKGSQSINFYARTRDGQSTGKRAKLLLIDDITKGQKEAYNVSLHISIVARYDVDWTSRADDDDLKIIALGTMWSRFDLLNVIQQRDEMKGTLEIDKDFKYTRLNVEKTSVYISVPALDYETDESTCPLRYSTEALRKKREEMADKALFNAVYQQKPEEPEDLIFGYSRLNTYDSKTYPKEILEGNYECKAMIDPNRRAKDYFTVLFYKRYIDDNNVKSKWYLCDAICRQKTFKQLKDDLIEKIIKNNVSHLGIEINTSNELPDYLKELLEEKGYNDIEIIEEYSTENKEQKIMQYQDEMINNIIYPQKNMFSPKSDLGRAMDWLTTYSTTTTNEHDDVPDCDAMFSKLFIENDSNNETVILSSLCRL